ncbi:hypothetical protein [Streptomyces sp. CAU 1734]|uniref:hypothetical protein n=1 Tax=Streptomyces sp. CAU 1734 TaxID=3140360 RepID=UPI0032611162
MEEIEPPGSPGGPGQQSGSGTSGVSGASAGRTQRYGLSTPQFSAPFVLSVLPAALLLRAVLLVTGEPVSAAGFRDSLGIFAAAALGCLLLPRPRAVTASPRGIVFGKGGRGRAEWGEVIGIGVRRRAGIRTVLLSLRDGRRITLRAPISFLDRRFDGSVAELRARWRNHRGDAEPSRDPGPGSGRSCPGP